MKGLDNEFDALFGFPRIQHRLQHDKRYDGGYWQNVVNGAIGYQMHYRESIKNRTRDIFYARFE